MVAPDSPQKEEDVDNKALNGSSERPEVTTKPSMNVGHQNPTRSDGTQGHEQEDGCEKDKITAQSGDGMKANPPTRCPQETPEQKRPKHVGFCKSDTTSPHQNERQTTEDNDSARSVDMEDGGTLSEMKNQDTTTSSMDNVEAIQPCGITDHNTVGSVQTTEDSDSARSVDMEDGGTLSEMKNQDTATSSMDKAEAIQPCRITDHNIVDSVHTTEDNDSARSVDMEDGEILSEMKNQDTAKSSMDKAEAMQPCRITDQNTVENDQTTEDNDSARSVDMEDRGMLSEMKNQDTATSSMDNVESIQPCRITDHNTVDSVQNTEDNNSARSVDIENGGTLSEMKNKDTITSSMDNVEAIQPCRITDHNTVDSVQTKPLSSEGKGTPSQYIQYRCASCLCKDCVENCSNAHEALKEQASNKEVKDNEVFPDNVSLNSNKLRGRTSSAGSRHSISSDGEFRGHRYEDAQVTLPYPDNGGPPVHITRLSNAGLYEPSDDSTGKMGMKDQEEAEDAGSQVISSAFFVQHQQLEGRSENTSKKVQLEMKDCLDIEKGEPEVECLLGNRRSKPFDEESVQRGSRCERTCLKSILSFMISLIIFPIFLYVAYTFLPFDTPLMLDIPTRLVYTLRCGAFASFPIVLGVVIQGIARLCSSSFDPFKPKVREVTIHHRFVKQSTFLFVLYFFNLAVLATYLPQEYLKLIPLLTCLFTLSQVIYWLSFAVGRSFRGFGYGLAFLPLLSMMICNLCFMFLVEPEKMVYLGASEKKAPKLNQN